MSTRSSTQGQAKLDSFVKGAGGASKGKSKAKSNDIESTTSSSKTKRPRPDGTDVPPEAKKPKSAGGGGTHKAFPANPPEPNELEEGATILAKFEQAYGQQKEVKHKNGGAVLYWMRMKDLRIKDNKALSLASETAVKLKKKLVILHVLSPGDYKAHDRAPIRIDWVLRNLRHLQEELDTYNIPLAIRTIASRKSIPDKVVELAKDWDCSHIFANLEYEVDELRRDIRVCELLQEEGAIEANYSHDYVIVKPGLVLSKTDKPYSVFSPFFRAWAAHISTDLELHSKEYPLPRANDDDIRKDSKLGKLFEDQVPESVEGFEMPSKEYTQKIHSLYPVGTEAAEEMLKRFATTKSRKKGFLNNPLVDGAEEDPKNSRLAKYSDDRNLPGIDGTSRLSPFLAAGIISPRACLRAILERAPHGKMPMTRDSGLGSWTQEICFRDFYQHVLVHWPRVSMGRNFVLKYEDVRWDDDPNGEKLKAWEEGRTGYPFIDAGMRQMREQGWMHNRVRMAVGSFLVKDLMLNWKEGERVFSRNLIDGDLGSNNAGWQWVAGTGSDPQPYFRVFNPFSQSEKFDPEGDYIRHFVPELKNVKGKAIHDPHKHLKISEFKATGYPKPIVDHASARKKAIARFKNPGTEADE